MMMDMEGGTGRDREAWETLILRFPYGLPSPCTPGIPFLFLEASDGDEPGTANSDLRFRILNQAPAQPFPDMFQLEPQLGALALSPNGEPELGVTGRQSQGNLKKVVIEGWVGT